MQAFWHAGIWELRSRCSREQKAIVMKFWPGFVSTPQDTWRASCLHQERDQCKYLWPRGLLCSSDSALQGRQVTWPLVEVANCWKRAQMIIKNMGKRAHWVHMLQCYWKSRSFRNSQRLSSQSPHLPAEHSALPGVLAWTSIRGSTLGLD